MAILKIKDENGNIIEVPFLRGPQGATGEPGPKGEKGDEGDPGIDGVTPIKGVDYFTSSDKEEFIAYVASNGQIDKVVPEYWNEAIANAEPKISLLADKGGANAPQFVWASDTHCRLNHNAIGTKATPKNVGKLANRLMNDLNIPYFIITGDLADNIGTKETLPDKNGVNEFFRVVVNPVGTERTLIALGNHDGVSILRNDDDTAWIYPSLTREERFNWYMKPFCNNFTKVWGDADYYYVDNNQYKIRYIILSGHNGEYTMDENRISTPNIYMNAEYGKEQLKWLSGVLLDTPNDYTIAVFSHFQLSDLTDIPKDSDILSTMLESFVNRVQFTVLEKEIDVNYSNSTAILCGMFVGHKHQDNIDTTRNFPLIRIACAGGDTGAGKTFIDNSDQETCLDVVTINTKEKKINMTRLGVGEDRVTSYKRFYLTVNGGKDSGCYLSISKVTIIPDEAPEGKKFGYWVDGKNNIKSYNKEYTFYPVWDTEMTAVFIPEDEQLTKQIIVNINSVDTAFEETKIKFNLSWYVPEEYNFITAGIIGVAQDVYNEETFNVDTTDPNIFVRPVSQSAYNTPINQYSWTKIKLNEETTCKTWIAKAYIQYKDASGNTVTVYSDKVTATYLSDVVYGD